MKRDSVFNPASTKLPEGWEAGKERKYKIQKNAVVIKINNPVYTENGFVLDADECIDELRNAKIQVIVYDIPTRYYLTTSNLWIFEECLQFEEEKKTKETKFHIPITCPLDELHRNSQPIMEYDIFINQACMMTHSAYVQMLHIFESVLGVPVALTASKEGISEYAIGMDAYLRNGAKMVQDLRTTQSCEYLLSVMWSQMPIKHVPARYIVGAFVRWCDRFEKTSDSLNEFKDAFYRLYMMYRNVGHGNEYRDIVVASMSKMLNLILSIPSDNWGIERNVQNMFKDIMKEAINKLEAEFWHFYSNPA